MADTAPAKAKIPPKPQPQKKKKKKNAPDKPQPAWLFPPDEENPVLNPKPKTDEDTIKETQEREKALNYMKRRVHAVPDRPAPPPQLLTLVGIFLTDFGFNSTSRLFTNERKARQELNGWEDAIGKKIEKGTPTLETIYRNWYREWKIQQKDETSSDESGSETSSESDSVAELSKKEAANSSGGGDDDSEASTDGLGGSDVEMKGAPKGKKGKAKNKRMLRSSSSSSSTTSESDADDEDEKAKPESTISKKAANTAKPAAYMPAVDFMVKSLKRKAASDPSDPSDPASSADKERLRQKKKVKTTSHSTLAPTGKIAETKPGAEDSSSSGSSSASDRESFPSPEESNAKLSKNHGSEKPVKAVPPLDSSESTSSSASESDSDSNSPLPASKQRANVPNKIIAQPPSLVQAPSSDSSATINGDSKKPSVSISSASDRSSATSSESSTSKSGSSTALSPKKKPEVPKLKMKHEGAQQTPLASLSANAAEHSYISNKYQNYEYAERAYKDLSVTRGKGFTKEKNKKKRGSYRGGAIDTAGGKSFKFAD
jgi:hypothetical protein